MAADYARTDAPLAGKSSAVAHRCNVADAAHPAMLRPLHRAGIMR